PGIHFPAKSPILSRVVNTRAQRPVFSERGLAPRYSPCECRLPRLLTPRRCALIAFERHIPRKRVKNSSLKQQMRFLRKSNTVFNAQLRSPAPQISSIRKRGLRECGYRRWRNRSKKKRVLSG